MLKKMMFAGLIPLLYVGAVNAASFRGLVTAVTDGDTIKVLEMVDSRPAERKIRLKGIDTPEKGQPYYQRAKQMLSEYVYNYTVDIEYDKKDRYGRIIGVVVLGGVDINLRMLDNGMAWHYKYYQKEQTPANRILYSEAEGLARGKRINIWKPYNRQVAPWDWRKGVR